jgi:hypothetical protein
MKWPNLWEEGVVVGCHLVAGCTSLPDWNDRQKPRAVAMLRRTRNCRKLLRCIMLLAVVIVEEWQCRSTVAKEACSMVRMKIGIVAGGEPFIMLHAVMQMMFIC